MVNFDRYDTPECESAHDIEEREAREFYGAVLDYSPFGLEGIAPLSAKSILLSVKGKEYEIIGQPEVVVTIAEAFISGQIKEA